MKGKAISSIIIIVIALAPFVAFAIGYRNFFTVFGMIVVALLAFLVIRSRKNQPYLSPELLKKYNEAEIALYYKTVMELRKEISEKKIPQYKKAVGGYVLQGKFDKAIELVETDAPNNEEAADRHIFKAKLCIADCRFKEAEGFYKKILDLSPKLEHLNSAATFFYDMRKLKEARRCYEACLNIEMTEVERATALNNLAMVYSDLQEASEAKTVFREALRLVRELVIAEPLTYNIRLARILDNLGELYRHTKDYDKAKEFHTEALELHRLLASQETKTYTADLAQSLNNMGTVHLAILEFDKAEACLAESLGMRKLLNQDKPKEYNFEISETLHNLGNLYVAIQDFQKAEESYSECLSISRTLAAQPSQSWTTYLVKGLVNASVFYFQCLADKPKAIGYVDEAIELLKGCKDTAEIRDLRDLAKKTRRKLEYS